MRQETLTTVKGGINRLRTKGAALKDSLYQLENGYVTSERTVKVRPGTVLDYTLPAGTKGLVAYNGKLHVFASSTVTGIDTDNFTLHYLRAPDGEALSTIHFAEPFLGFLYVAAEFADGDIYHFWLQSADVWEADTYYNANQFAEPTTSNTYIYRATRLGAPYPVWIPDMPVSVGTNVEPPSYNGLYFEVISVVGDNPRTGTSTPDFAVAEGELVVETVDSKTLPPDPTPLPRPDADSPDLDDRYRPTWAPSRISRG